MEAIYYAQCSACNDFSWNVGPLFVLVPLDKSKRLPSLDVWLAVHHSITFLLLPTWYTNFLFIHINYIKLNSSTRFERNPLIIRRSTTQIVHMQPLVSSLSASDRLVQPLRKDLFIYVHSFMWMNNKFVYQVDNNNKVKAYQVFLKLLIRTFDYL
jgi:hypothetical protein